MQITFHSRDNGPERLIAEAEVQFGNKGLLAGMKLVGFTLWRSADGAIFVTLPARTTESGGERRFFDLLRASNGSGDSVKAVKARILEAYHAAEQADS